MSTQQTRVATRRVRRGRLAVGSIAVWALVAGCANTSLPGSVGSASNESQQLDGQQPAEGASTAPGITPGQAGSSGGSGTAGSGATTGTSTGGTSTGGATTGTTGSASGTGTSGSGSGASGGTPVKGSTVGVTKTQITIDASGPFSGYLAPVADQVYQNAAQVWQNEINAQGGINGRKIRLVKVDNQYTPAGAVAACKKAQSDGAFMVVNLLGATNQIDCLDAARIPVLDRSASYLRDWSYAVALQYGGAEGPTLVSLMKSHWMNWQTKKVGIVYTGNDQISTGVFKSVEAAMKKAGLRLVHAEAITQNQSSYVPQMSRMQSSGVDAVALLCFCLDANHIIADAHAIGYFPQFGFGGAGSSDVIAKLGGPLFEGMIGARIINTVDSAPYATFKSKVAKFGGDPNQADTTQMGFYGMFDALGEALRRAGPDLTRQGLMAALHSLVSYDRYHMIAPVTWKDRNVGATAQFPLRCCSSDYNWQGLGPAAEAFK